MKAGPWRYVNVGSEGVVLSDRLKVEQCENLKEWAGEMKDLRVVMGEI